MSKRDQKNGVPTTVTSIPLVDPHAMPANPSIGELVRDATTQVSTLVRAEVELAKAEITRDVKKGLTGSVFFIIALVVLLYSTFFMFFFLAELLDTWLWRWAAFLIVFILMLVVTAVFALLGYLKVRRIRGPQQTIESVKETTAALTPGISKFAGSPSPAAPATIPSSRPAPAASETRTRPTPPKPDPGWATPAAPAAPARVIAPEPEAPRAQIAAGPVVIASESTRDATAAVYADTGLPVTTDHEYGATDYHSQDEDSQDKDSQDEDPIPGDPSGW